MKIVIPLAGKDERFEKLGIYKPLISIGGKPLIYHVLSHNPFPLKNLFFILLAEHEKKYSVTKKLKDVFGSNISISIIDKTTKGSPETILKIKDLINSKEDLLIELGDVVRSNNSLDKVIANTKYDGIIPIDENFTAPVWGYVLREENEVTQLKEKITIPILGGATMGLYYFRGGDKFVEYTKRMIDKKITINNGGYFIGPIYNEYISDGKKIAVASAKIKAVLGSPDEISVYKKSYNL